MGFVCTEFHHCFIVREYPILMFYTKKKLEMFVNPEFSVIGLTFTEKARIGHDISISSFRKRHAIGLPAENNAPNLAPLNQPLKCHRSVHSPTVYIHLATAV